MNDPDRIPQEDGPENPPPPLISKRFLVLLAYTLIAIVVWGAAAIGSGSSLFPRPVRIVLEILALSPIVGWLLYMILQAVGVLLEAGTGITAFIKPLSHRKKFAGAIVISTLVVAFGADKFWRHFESRRAADNPANATPARPRTAPPSTATAPARDASKLPASTNPAAELNRLIYHSPIIFPAAGLATQPAH